MYYSLSEMLVVLLLREHVMHDSSTLLKLEVLALSKPERNR